MRQVKKEKIFATKLHICYIGYIVIRMLFLRLLSSEFRAITEDEPTIKKNSD